MQGRTLGEVGEGCRGRRGMKVLPLTLPPVGAASAAAMDRMPLSLPFSPTDLLWRWRYPLGFPAAPAPAPPSPQSPLLDFKTHLPASLASDPRVWTRDDVSTFLRWSEREFDLSPFDMEMFQMNGKALCLLTKGDLAERCPGAGDVLHNVLQLLARDAQALRGCLPSSPVTPTSRHHAYPPPHPATLAWPAPPAPGAATALAAAASAQDFQAPNLAHLVQQGNSVTLSPAPSVDSQAGSPQHADHLAGSSYHSGGSNGSNQSDTDEDSYQENGTNGLQAHSSPPSTPAANTVAPSLPQPLSPKKEQLNALNGNNFKPVREMCFFPTDSPEPNTNGRLLWDFLQQLLNDPSQRYTNYIAWRNRETGVFKIVDPAGLAKLWGIQKNHLSMNYDKMSRALRYYYRVNILRKVQGERHCYQFLRNPSELKSIKNMSLLRQQMSPTRPPTSLQQQQQQQQQQMNHLQGPHHQSTSVSQIGHPSASLGIKMEPETEAESPTEDDGPTDLSISPTSLQQQQMNHLQGQSPSMQQHQANHLQGAHHQSPTLPHSVHPSAGMPMKREPEADSKIPAEDDGPTDLSMDHPTDLSPSWPTSLTDCTAALLCHVVKVKSDDTEVSDEK